MSDYTEEVHLARIAGDIMFSDRYLDLLERTYSDQDTIVEFEASPKEFLMRHGIHIPNAIDVIIHDPGEVGRRARVDFHWGPWVEPAPPDRSATQELRDLARMAWDTLNSSEMKQLRQAVQTSPGALQEFASNPKAFAAAHKVTIPDGMDLIVHQDDPNDLRIDIHFGDLNAGGPRARGGCCYCSDGGCCYYA